MSSITNTTEMKTAFAKSVIADDVANIKDALADLNIIKIDAPFSHIIKIGIQTAEKSLKDLINIIDDLTQQNEILTNKLLNQQQPIHNSEEELSNDAIHLIIKEMERVLCEFKANDKDSSITKHCLIAKSSFLEIIVTTEQIDTIIEYICLHPNASKIKIFIDDDNDYTHFYLEN